MTEITEEVIHKAIESDGKVLLLLTAPAWCVPCQRFHPHWEKAKEKMPDVTFIEIDLGETPESTQDHWAYGVYNVRSVPTIMAFRKDGIGTVSHTTLAARAVVPFIKEASDFFEQ